MNCAGECWCIPDNGGLGLCPDWAPTTSYSEEVVNIYKNQIPQKFYELSCNPYTDKTCKTKPEQDLLDVDTAVCALVYTVGGSETCLTYNMVTFATRQAAEAEGAVVTHEGSCGLCSTTVDLALYLSEKLFDTIVSQFRNS